MKEWQTERIAEKGGKGDVRIFKDVESALDWLASFGYSTPLKKDWQVYLLKCSDNSLYCGVTKNLDARIKKHNLGTASKYTRSRLPVTCVAQSPPLSKRRAFQLEYRTKRLPAEKKQPM